MDEHRTSNGPKRADYTTPEGRDILISRVIDAEASGEDWDAFRALAERDPAVWRELASAQEQHEHLCEALRAASGVADSVDLPELVGDVRHTQRRLDSVGRWGGWAAAAAILLVWTTGLNPSVNTGGLQTGSLAPGGPALSEATPDQALQRYIDAGQNTGLVVGEMPDRVVVETRPRADGSVEVVYIRQIIERRVTNQVFRQATDEAGRSVALPVPTTDIQRPRAY